VSIFGEPVFAFPKPQQLITQLLEQGSDRDSIVLDCCAGSGTTAHATLALNNADGGHRRFIVIQQAFDTKAQERQRYNVCRKITRDRIAAVISGWVDKSPNSKDHRRVPGVGGEFTYARLSQKPLFGEYKDFGDELPSYEEIARYVFYTETSRDFPGTDRRRNPAWDKRAGRIAQHAGRSYYLLYKPNHRLDWGLDREFLSGVAAKDPNRELVVYCEKVWVHREELRAFTRETGKRIRPMLVPFNLK